MRRLLSIAVLVGLLGAAGTAGAATPSPQLNATGRAPFPTRSFVLTLPASTALGSGDVKVTENGRPVLDLQVTPAAGAGNRTFGVILAIDASESMRDRIGDAMIAARAFAARRAPSQPLGVLFFSREPRIALAPTTDSASIAKTLAHAPLLTKGTRTFDAAKKAMDVLDDARITAGSVVVLSDGADVGSKTTPEQLAQFSRATGTRIFAVGIESPSYDGEQVRDLAAAGRGDFALAHRPRALREIFARLGRRLSNEYLVTYRSREALGSQVLVTARTAGFPGPATASYTAPAAPATGGPRRRVAEDSFWSGAKAPMLIALGLAALFGFVMFGLMRPGRRSLRHRVAAFVGPLEKEEPADVMPVIKRSQASTPTSGSRWEAFVEDVDVAGIAMPARRIAVFTVTATLALMFLLVAVAGNVPLGLISLGLPVAVRTAIGVKARRVRGQFAEQLGDNLQALASALRAGYSFSGALNVIVDDAAEPSRAELSAVVHAEQLGVPLQDALDQVGRRMRNTELQYVGIVAAVQRDAGGNTAEVLDRVAGTIRERSQLRRMVQGLTAQGRLGGAVVSGLPLAMIAINSTLSPGYMDPLFQETTGQILLGGAAVMTVLGWVAIKRIVTIDV